MTTKNTKTELHKSIIDPEIANFYFENFKNTIPWQDGIYSKRAKKMTRMAFSVEKCEAEYEKEIFQLIISCLHNLGIEDAIIGGIYLNYYLDGNHWCPSHSHPGTRQLVISLGATRKLRVGNTIYDLESGDLIIFGCSNHELLIDESVKEGRISIACFMEK